MGSTDGGLGRATSEAEPRRSSRPAALASPFRLERPTATASQGGAPFAGSPRVARLVFDVPGAAVNVLRATFADDLSSVLDEIERDPTIEAVVLVSGKPDGFIAGADLAMVRALQTSAEAEEMSLRGQAVVARLAAAKKPVVAAVHGAALGGGFEVALACRARVVSDAEITAFGFPEVRLGLLPCLNGLPRLAALAGLEAALEYGVTGKPLRPEEAKALGVVDEVVPASVLEAVAAKVALELANPLQPASAGGPRSRPAASSRFRKAALEQNSVGRALLFAQARHGVLEKTRGHYPAPLKVVRVLEVFAREGFGRAAAEEARAFGELAVSSSSARLLEGFAAQQALKKDTSKSATAAAAVGRLAIVGAGAMGAGIAALSADAGFAVRVRDTSHASLARAVRSMTGDLDARVAARRLTCAERDERLARVTTATDWSGLSKAELVIEAVFEELALKQEILREVEAHAPEGAVFGSNSSSLPIARIAERAARPENVVGMHYFSPAQRMPLLEVVRGPKSSEAAIATAVAVGRKQGKTVIVVNDGVGFFTTRILAPYMNEAAHLLREGASIEAVDRALVDWGFPVGPFELIDEVGLDVAAHTGSILAAAFGARFEAPNALARLVADDRRGKKNGRGFYLHGASAARARPGLRGSLSSLVTAASLGARSSRRPGDPAVYARLGLREPDARAKPRQLAEEIQMRCVLPLVNEALHCIGDGIVRSARDGDVGAIFGLGFPPFRGGPFRYVDATGANEILGRLRRLEDLHGARFTPAPALVDLAKRRGRLYT